jgi:hypothetical protein
LLRHVKALRHQQVQVLARARHRHVQQAPFFFDQSGRAGAHVGGQTTVDHVEHVHLLVPQRFYVTQQSAYGDRHLYGSLSRFIPAPVAAMFEVVGPAAPPAAAHESATPAVPDFPAPLDIAARLRSAW